MEAFLDKVRDYDFGLYKLMHTAIYGHPFINGFYLFFAKYGIVFFFLSFTYLIWKKKITAFLCSLLAMGIAGGFDLLIFAIWRRPRPFISHSDILTPITEGLRVDSSSFPSAHTYIVFAIATSAFLYGHKRLGTLLFLLAIVVAIGRIGSGLHYPSDILGGIFLGIASGIIAYIMVSKMEKNWE